MGSFASLLGGLATGARDAYKDYSDTKQKQEFENNKLVAEAIHQRLTTDDSLQFSEQDHLFDQYLQLHGIKDKKVRDGLRNAAGYHRQAMAEAERKAGYGKQQPELGGGDQSSAPGVTQGADGAPDVSLPPMPMAPTAGIPQLPAPPEGYQTKTAGQLKFEESQPRVVQAEKDKANAQRQAIRQGKTDSLEDDFALFKKYEGTDMEDEARYKLGMAPRSVSGSGVAGAFVPGNGTRGTDLIEIYRRQGKTPQQIEAMGIIPSKLYGLVVGHDKTTVVNHIAKEESAVGTGHEASGTQVKALGLTTDRGGAPIVDGGTYTIIHSAQGGGILGAIPTAQLATYSQQHKVNFSVTSDGIVETPYTENSSTQKGLPNTPAGGAVPLPGGKTPTPSTPLPQSPMGANGRPTPGPPAPPNPYTETVKPGTVIGQKPLTQGEFTNLNNAKQGLRSLEKLKAKIESDPSVLLKASIPGSPGARLFATWKNELSDIITRLRTGAALNEEEQHFYQSQMPGLLDLIGQKVEPKLIEDKLKIYDGLFNGVVTQYGRRAAGGYSPEAVRAAHISLMAPNGEVMDVPVDQTQYWLKKGAKIVGR